MYLPMTNATIKNTIININIMKTLNILFIDNRRNGAHSPTVCLLKSLLFVFVFAVMFSSCSAIKVSHVGYQSVRTTYKQPQSIPDDVEIVVAIKIDIDGNVTPIIFNPTNEIMTIDNTKSFFVNSDGSSMSYYDPTIRTVSTTSSVGSSSTYSRIDNSITSSSNSVSQRISGRDNTLSSLYTTTNVSTLVDQPTTSLAPKGKGAMPHTYQVLGLGRPSIKGADHAIRVVDATPNDSYCTFSVVISYSFDNGRSYKKIVTNFYSNAFVVVPVEKKNGYYQVNEAIRSVYSAKADALQEPWFLLHVNTEDHKKSIYNSWGCFQIWYNFQ